MSETEPENDGIHPLTDKDKERLDKLLAEQKKKDNRPTFKINKVSVYPEFNYITELVLEILESPIYVTNMKQILCNEYASYAECLLVLSEEMNAIEKRFSDSSYQGYLKAHIDFMKRVNAQKQFLNLLCNEWKEDPLTGVMHISPTPIEINPETIVILTIITDNKSGEMYLELCGDVLFDDFTVGHQAEKK